LIAGEIIHAEFCAEIDLRDDLTRAPDLPLSRRPAAIGSADEIGLEGARGDGGVLVSDAEKMPDQAVP
jgi:hypothetical protein